jgi:hypothetical protein
MTDRAYFEELGTALRGEGFPSDRIATTIADLTGYLAETGTTAADEFGPAARFAAQLSSGGRPGGEEPDSDAETWRWNSDIYADRRLLNEYGAQGWEVERIDRLGQFVSRRVPGAAMRWEYRREMTHNAEARRGVTAELAPDGWEPCGEWFATTYYKRPVAATSGAAAALASTPGRPARRLFLSRRYRFMLVGWVILVAALGVLFVVTDIDLAGPALVGAVVGAVVGGFLAARGIRRDLARGIES